MSRSHISNLPGEGFCYFLQHPRRSMSDLQCTNSSVRNDVSAHACAYEFCLSPSLGVIVSVHTCMPTSSPFSVTVHPHIFTRVCVFILFSVKVHPGVFIRTRACLHPLLAQSQCLHTGALTSVCVCVLFSSVSVHPRTCTFSRALFRALFISLLTKRGQEEGAGWRRVQMGGSVREKRE